MTWRVIFFWLLGANLALADLPQHSRSWITTFSGDGEVTNRVWLNSSGQTNRTQSLSWDAKGRLHSVTDLDSTTSGFTWTAVFDGLGRRLQTTTVMETNGVSVSTLPQIINQYYDPGVQFLELAVAVNGVLTSKYYGPDANGVYGGMSGVGGLEAVSASPQAPSAIVSDIRGNGYAVYSVAQGSLVWYSSRVTGYGAVPGFRPLPLGDGAGLAAASAWRGKWADITGNYQLGCRPYNPIFSHFIGADPFGHNADPSLYGFCGGDPINYFDPDGRLATQVGREVQTDWNSLPQFALNVGNNVEQGNNDFWTGAFNSAGGLANAAAHPINTTASAINGVATLAANLTVDASGTVNNLYNGFANNFSDPNRASQFVGSLTFGTETAIGGGAAFQALTDVAETGTTLDQLSGAANRAAQNVGSGSGPVYGTQVHTAFQAEVEGLGNPTLFTEQSYLNGIPVEYGTPGSIRIDVGEGTVNAPTAVYDLKTGSATLTPARIQQIQSHLPGGSSVPVITIRP